MPSCSVAIVNSGGANLASLIFALQRLGVDAVLTTEPHVLRNSSHVILPGVGSASDAMNRLHALDLIETLRGLTQPVLGICLGMQLMATRSEEHNTACIDVIDGVARLLPATPQLPVPNMGWCEVSQCQDNPLFAGIPDRSYFYFIHSYALAVSDKTIATATHTTSFAAAMRHENFFATQFHPERSAAAGGTLLRNFVNIPS